MKSHTMASIATAAVIAAAAGTGAGAALAGHSTAATPPAASSASPQPSAHPKAHGKKDKGAAAKAAVHQLVELVASKTGLSYDAVVSDLQSGQTLDQIAGSQDQAVKDAATQMLQQRLDAAVTAGKLTQDEETKRLSAFTTMLNKVMAAPGQHVLALLNGKGGHAGAAPGSTPGAANAPSATGAAPTGA